MDFRKMADYRNRNNPYAAKLGIFVEEIGPGYARVTKTVREDDLNPVGVAHGGCYFSMADTASGSAMASQGYAAVTVSANYNFLRSAKIGDTITAESRAVKTGRTISVFNVQLSDQDGVLLGTGTFTFYKLERKLEI
jgi:acyl-CoA thioesterase